MSFRDIIGHEKAIEILRRTPAGRHAGAYLFCGPEGIGKKMVAMAFAKKLLCPGQGPDSCDGCSSCRKFDAGQHPDMHGIDNGYEEEIKREDILTLQESINLRPYESAVKVYVINDAHNLNQVSGNAFLKTLEEPPAHSAIILVTDKPGLLLKTVVSRCQRIKFSGLSRMQLGEYLRSRAGYDEASAHYLSFFCEGRLGDALAHGSGDVLGKKNRVIDGLLFADRARHAPPSSDRGQFRRDMHIIASWFRDVYLLKAGQDAGELVNFDRASDLYRMAGRYSFARLDEIMATLSHALLHVQQNVNVKLLLSNLELAVRNA